MTLLHPACSLTGTSPSPEFLAHTAPEPEPRLWFSDYEHDSEWHHLPNLQHARDLIRTRRPGNPWVSLLRDASTSNDGEYRGAMFEVLGWADTVYVTGDVIHGDTRWCWSSWPAGFEPRPKTRTTVGPPWFQATVYDAQVLTVHDALAQLIPGLHALPGITIQAPGSIWLNRNHDAAPNEHLRE